MDKIVTKVKAYILMASVRKLSMVFTSALTKVHVSGGLMLSVCTVLTSIDDTTQWCCVKEPPVDCQYRRR